ncbi:MAG: TRIC cation channel family protein [Acidimicrobiaceae bacterium]|nr:TRIC cation channel family protein [Acidimicrobiaceae bacterium]
MGTVFATSVTFWNWHYSGNFTAIDLIAASTNALNGALLARRPDHYKNFTIIGILGMALLGGLGGGIARDVLINKDPTALFDPTYIVLCLVFGLVGYQIAYKEGQLFREGIFQFMTAFSLPWYAIIGAQAGVIAKVPLPGCLLLAVIGPTAGRWLIDVSCGVTPKQFIRSEWFVSIAALTGLIWILVTWAGASAWPATVIAFAVGFVVRLLALYRGWEEPLASEPRGAYVHGDGRPLLGRKLSGKSQRELRELGLTADQAHSDAA